MNLQNRLFLVLVEIAGAMWISYQQMPPDKQQAIRLRFYDRSAALLRRAARFAGEEAIAMENRYTREVRSNG